MASLVPCLKLSVVSAEAHFRSPHHTLHLNAKVLAHFRMQCASSQMSIVVERPQMPSLEVNSSSLASSNPLTYVGAFDQLEKIYLEKNLLREPGLTSEAAAIAVMAAEALVLAKEAVKVARDAAHLLGIEQCLKFKMNDFASGDEKIKAENLSQVPSNFSLMTDELNLPQNLIVRSKRQIERRVRRARVAEAAIVRVSSGKLGSSGRKRRATLRAVDFSDPLHYLRDMSRTSKLLTATEEQQLSEGIQELLKLERKKEELAERIGRQPTTAQWATFAGLNTKTLMQRLNYGIDCRDKMIKSNIRLVISIAKKFNGAGMSIQDLVQAGFRGLLRGAEMFDGTKGFKFSTYAYCWIRDAVRRCLTNQSRMIRLPLGIVEACYRIREARNQLYLKNRTQPDDREIAEAAGLTMKRFETVMLAPKAPISMDQRSSNYESSKLSEVTGDPEASTRRIFWCDNP
ncbi:hypothetical protein HPP92_008350 [Vanilla planifolia]|uniref:Sigma factor n=1 Tax=Vanilla planifolia TaxID=51239 RepID=A0A835V5X6_VANPL|nr:hypothetical protein HPP92_008350 [Vanilla planifolia]